MSTYDRPPRYQAYLLRLWQERSQHPARLEVWRFSLEEPQTGVRRGFTSLEAVMSFIESQIEGDGSPVE
jgi:hypothetical protein